MPNELDTPEVIETPIVQNTNQEDALERARVQERNKLYSKIKKEEEARQAAEAKSAEIEAQLKELAKFKEQVELEKLGEKERLEKQIVQLQSKLNESDKALAVKEKALDEKIKIYELAEYRIRRIKEERLDEDFADFVGGDTEEEVEAGISKAKEKEAKFKEKYTVKPERGPRVPPSNPSPDHNLNPGGNQVTWEDIENAGSQKELDALKKKLWNRR